MDDVDGVFMTIDQLLGTRDPREYIKQANILEQVSRTLKLLVMIALHYLIEEIK